MEEKTQQKRRSKWVNMHPGPVMVNVDGVNTRVRSGESIMAYKHEIIEGIFKRG